MYEAKPPAQRICAGGFFKKGAAVGNFADGLTRFFFTFRRNFFVLRCFSDFSVIISFCVVAFENSERFLFSFVADEQIAYGRADEKENDPEAQIER